MRKLWSILIEEARWPYQIAFVVALLLLFAMITGCAPTPAMQDECPTFFSEEADIIKCKKRVMMREDRAFELQQIEARKELCAVQDKIWVKVDRNQACMERADVVGLFY